MIWLSKNIGSRANLYLSELGRVKIIKLGLRVQLFLEDKYPLVLYQIADFAFRVEQVTELAGSDRADLLAGGVTPRLFSSSLDTEGTFLHNPFRTGAITKVVCIWIDFIGWNRRLGPVEVPRSIWAGGHTVSAADTPVVIDDDDPVVFLPSGLNRTDLGAGGFFALLALNRHVEMPFFRHLFRVVILFSMRQINTFFLVQLHDPNPVNLWSA